MLHQLCESEVSPAQGTPKSDRESVSLRDLFSQIPSPPPHAELYLDGVIQTPLFQYQIDSVSHMISMEEGVIDVEASIPNSNFFNRSTQRGGILCENMGTGKTLMMISLIAATLRKPVGLHENEAWNVALTIPHHCNPHAPVAQNHDSEPKSIEWMVKSLENESTLSCNLNGQKSIPSLTHLALAAIKFRNSPLLNEHVESEFLDHIALPFRTIQQFMNEEFVRHSVRKEFARGSTTNTAISSSQYTHKVHLSKTTLIVVPDTLLHQWMSEFNKHVCPGEIRKLDLIDAKTPIPSPLELSEYDVVLISHHRLSLEESKFGFEFQGVALSCTCPYKGSSRSRECRCEEMQLFRRTGVIIPSSRRSKKSTKKKNATASTTSIASTGQTLSNSNDDEKKKKTKTRARPKKLKSDGYVSPLMQVHFRRLIFDEGHLLKHESGNETKLLDTVSKLKAQCKWVCSGTPLPNIFDDAVHVDKNRRLAMEKVDLRKLGGIVSNYMKLEPFCFDKSLFAKVITAPWLAGNDEGIRRVEHLFQQIFVRHRVEDIQNQHPLPPLYEKTVVLRMNEQERINTNILISQIKLNAVLTEREGVDYFGHPSLRDALHQVVSNLKLSLFHFNGTEIVTLARNSHKNAIEGMMKAVDGSKPYDVELLSTIVSHLQRSEDQMYEAQQYSRDILYSVRECSCLWRCGGVLDDGWDFGSLIDFKSRQRLLTKEQLIRHFKELKLIKVNADVGLSDILGYSESETTAKAAEVNAQSVSTPQKRKKTVMFGPSPLSTPTNPEISSPQKKKAKVSFSIDSMEIETIPAPSASPPHNEPQEPLSNPKPKLCSTCESSANLSIAIEASTCTKLTYLGDQILKHHMDEKIIIYTTHDNEMHAVKEFCELVGIKFLLFQKTGQSMSVKSNNVTTFNSAAEIRVFIMDISRAAYGLDLSTASRIYFLRPVAETAIYKQAVKRAHRLGCIRPVYVEVLAFEGTLEVVGGGSAETVEKGTTGDGKSGLRAADLKMKDLIDVAPFVEGSGYQAAGLPSLFTPHVAFSEPILKFI